MYGAVDRDVPLLCWSQGKDRTIHVIEPFAFLGPLRKLDFYLERWLLCPLMTNVPPPALITSSIFLYSNQSKFDYWIQMVLARLENEFVEFTSGIIILQPCFLFLGSHKLNQLRRTISKTASVSDYLSHCWS